MKSAKQKKIIGLKQIFITTLLFHGLLQTS